MILETCCFFFSFLFFLIIPPFFLWCTGQNPSFLSIFIFVTEQDQACPLLTPTANQPITGLRLTACRLVEGPLLKLETGVREGTQGGVSDCEGGERGCCASR